jgi:hypothetical protein
MEGEGSITLNGPSGCDDMAQDRVRNVGLVLTVLNIRVLLPELGITSQTYFVSDIICFTE